MIFCSAMTVISRPVHISFARTDTPADVTGVCTGIAAGPAGETFSVPGVAAPSPAAGMISTSLITSSAKLRLYGFDVPEAFQRVDLFGRVAGTAQRHDPQPVGLDHGEIGVFTKQFGDEMKH